MSPPRVFVLLASIAILLVPPHASAWDPNGVPVTAAAKVQQLPSLAPDDVGGFYVSWVDQRRSANDGYLQHLGPDGSVAPGWPANGLAISETGTVGQVFVVRDGTGGALVLWTDSAPTSLRAQRIDATGIVHASWPAAGKLLTTDLYNTSLSVAPDGSGGAYVARIRAPMNPELISATVTRITADGLFAFSEAGVGIGGDNQVTSYRIEADPSGGVVFSTTLYFNGPVDQYYARVGRIADNAAITTFHTPQGFRVFGAVATPDGAGGLYTVYRGVDMSAVPFWNGQHVAAGGSLLWPQPTPVPVTEALANGGPSGVYLVGAPDGSDRIELHRRASDGSIPAEWPVAGILLRGPTAPPGAAIMASGDAVIACWIVPGDGTEADLQATRILTDGTIAPGWSLAGTPVTRAAGGQSTARLLPAANDGAFVVWHDDRAGAINRDLYAKAIGPAASVDVPTGPAASLSLSIAPNPASEMLHVAFASPASSGASLDLLDVRGRVVHRSDVAGRSTISIPVGGLSAGIYLVSLRDGGTPRTGRAIVFR
ncbi:MAG: T9SS type A sorting domain-containing protein [Candidatus Eiseniibacteriota bacterium]